MSAKKICFDRILPRDLALPHRALSQGPLRPSRAISPRNKQWPNGATLTVAFKGGSSTQQQMVRQYAPEWTEYANLRFDFVTTPNAKIRVAFDANDGAWSYVGTDNLEIPIDAVTLNLGWQDKAVILHEFGHMVGFAHEHQNPQGGITWNEAAVIADLSGAPNYWDESTIRHNVIEKYSLDQIYGTAFDAQSIMLYAFPASWTIGGSGTHENTDLSATDKSFVGGPQMYPGQQADAVTEIPVQKALAAAISNAGEQDTFKFVVVVAGNYVIETGGSTDVITSLYGPNSMTKLIARDDDSGAGANSRLEAALQPGTYYLQIRHYSSVGTGPYKVWIAG